MIQIKDTPYSSTASLMQSAIKTAEFFGFQELDSIPRSPTAKKFSNTDVAKVESNVLFARREEKALSAVARKFLSVVPPSHGVTLAWKVRRTTGTNPQMNFELHIFGTSTVLAETMLIVVTRAILQSIGLQEQSVSINNIGTTESSGRFVRDVGIFLRKHTDSISPALQPRIEHDPVGTLVQLIEKGHPAIARAPQAFEYLTEEERRRLWDLLEHLETLRIFYEMDGKILGSRDCWAHTLFEIRAAHPESGIHIPVAFGGRYDALASRFARKSTGAVMVSIPCEIKGGAIIPTSPKSVVVAKPAFFYAYVGTEARKKSLAILEVLRLAGIPILHELWHDRMGEQMERARTLSFPFILIMGHKEALENTVIVREVANNAQETVPAGQLVQYLKRHKMVA
ncbi:MAG: hypothetical protein JWO50_531 [Candidatus Kaiserbacteria bacterium]|nr:hypothetical protein [Candidatus Kaiserbacteria bacterium]